MCGSMGWTEKYSTSMDYELSYLISKDSSEL
jgi:hypothetical protein